MVIDATNLYGVVPPAGFPSNAEFVKSKTNGPDCQIVQRQLRDALPRLSEARARPGNLWCGDAETREVVEQLEPGCRLRPRLHGSDRKCALQRVWSKLSSQSREHGHVRLPDGPNRAALILVD